MRCHPWHQEIIEDVEDDAAREAGLVAAGQAAEHDEIARYGTLATRAGLLGLDDAVGLLNETLTEEKKADEASGFYRSGWSQRSGLPSAPPKRQNKRRAT